MPDDQKGSSLSAGASIRNGVTPINVKDHDTNNQSVESSMIMMSLIRAEMYLSSLDGGAEKRFHLG